MQVLPTPTPLSLSLPTTTTTKLHLSLRSSTFITSPLSLIPNLFTLTISRPPSTLIRMGGGPRTFPGGVSKWQWKRMQSKKAKQLLKARLARERHIYEMRKRAELKAAVSELERPWELVKKASPTTSTLFSVGADEQLKVLADRFQKPGGFDMWTENDGPQIFVTPDEGLPTARFFPKGVVHSIRPYERIDNGNVGGSSGAESSDFAGSKTENKTGVVKRKNGHRKRILASTSRDDKMMESSDGNSRVSISKPSSNGVDRSDSRGVRSRGGVSRMDGDRKSVDRENGSNRRLMDSRQGSRGLEGGNRSFNTRKDGSKLSGRGQNFRRSIRLNSEDVYDMSVQGDGSYGFGGSDQDDRISSQVYEKKMIKSNFSE
ncbi:uncharacterized protein LOC141647751 [Silene latifolia]|uniref:uncharacterized protein LOC141647751 n=1 Tax=Silene latifolia TaxID=37657 RepID=UPI003D777C6D